MIYFAVTTLTTVGFGDFHPKSNSERIVMTFILFSGVMVFSMLMGVFLEILIHYKNVTKIHDESEQLSRFFGLMAKFNIRPWTKQKIQEYEQYFKYYWKNDKIIFIKTDENYRIF